MLEMGLNCVHEATHSLYIKHVYNGAVADTFLGDDLFGADRAIPVEERVENAARKATVGQSGRGNITFGRRGGGRRGRFNNNYITDRKPQHDKERYYNNDYTTNVTPIFGRFDGNGSFGSNNGTSRGNVVGTCFICGSTGQQAKQCPKAAYKNRCPSLRRFLF